ncbi:MULTISPECIES: DUF3618 domain-containing protein [unclassified Pseudonocardia]|uniref:DUF3618 domain-containing protein n=1 Tax=unclassified Pseudonocardia TaxID=2619320 RepID=UPI0009685E7A|nr:MULTISPECIES: DUF3618 domain-containing protein [unclassified Pseudonocardia]MBN9099941.1 DUF3618 domain-containing protein [Pseudonocardia sp.]OJY48133.1 MAG: hypothetical protein BGP03_10740 [Pseudonocardia sp. 73-21]
MTGAQEQRSPGELRADLGELRADLGETVEELAHRADVPARAKEKRDEVVGRVQEQAATARTMVAGKAPFLEDPKVLAGIGAVLVALLVVLRRRRRA